MTATLHFGDCFDVMPTLRASSVDMILADLPYGTTQCAWDSELPYSVLFSPSSITISRNGKSIHLPAEAWVKIVEKNECHKRITGMVNAPGKDAAE